jgi:hypothetical protein
MLLGGAKSRSVKHRRHTQVVVTLSITFIQSGGAFMALPSSIQNFEQCRTMYRNRRKVAVLSVLRKTELLNKPRACIWR